MTRRAGRATLDVASVLVATAVFASLVCIASGDVHTVGARSEKLSAGGGVTSVFHRPPAHPALDLSDARVSRRSRPNQRVLRETSATATEPDTPEQVHLIPYGPNAIVVVWATELSSTSGVVDPDATVAYVPQTSSGSKTSTKYAYIATTAYTAQMCLGESMSVDPVMGNREPVDLDFLVRLANTSAWAPTDAANYEFVKNADGIIPKKWFHNPPWEKAICLRYNNPDAQYQSPFIHTAVMKGLAPGKTYEYILPGDEISHNSRTFTSLLGPGDKHSENKPLVLGVVGDTGQTEVTHAVFEHLMGTGDDSNDLDSDSNEKQKIDLLLHVGDLSYADGYAPRWDSFGRLAEPLLSGTPMLITPGNHDVTLNGLESIAFRTRYPSPHRSSQSPSPDWWSLDVGLAHVVGLSSYAPGGARSEVLGEKDRTSDTYTDADMNSFGIDGPTANAMKNWLLRDLQKINREKTPWVVVMFHVPWYNSNEGHFKEAERHRWALEKTLYESGADIILNGHVHSYERSIGVYDWNVNECGPRHIVIGDGGNYEGPYGGGWRDPQPQWSAFREGSFGAGRLVIVNETTATWAWHRTTCVEAGGTTVFNETWYAPTGDDGVNCKSSNDVSAQAMEAVDSITIHRNTNTCPNKKAGTGTGSRSNDDNSDDDSSGDDSRKCPSLHRSSYAAAIDILAALLTGSIATSVWALLQLRRERNGSNQFRHTQLTLGDHENL